jgi:hypothetical protein
MSEDQEEVDYHQRILSFITRLVALLPRLFPTTIASEFDPCILFLHDLHQGNIMVDKHGKIIAMIDWEFIPTVPLWQACQVPKFLVGPERLTPPKKHNYLRPEWKGEVNSPPEDIKDEYMWEGYYDDLDEYQMGFLRQTFLSEMLRIEPAWLECHKYGMWKRDFIELVQAAELGYIFSARMPTWLDDMEKGRWTPGLLTKPFDYSGAQEVLETITLDFLT